MIDPNRDLGSYLEKLAREGQVKLEITGGTHTWRLLPSPTPPEADRPHPCEYWPDTRDKLRVWLSSP